MARTPKPWYRADRQAYFVTVGGTRHNLGPNKKEADRRFHELIARAAEPPDQTADRPTSTAALTVADVFEKFLDWCHKHRAPRTYEWSRNHIQAFCDHLKTARKLPALALRPFHGAVTE